MTYDVRIANEPVRTVSAGFTPVGLVTASPWLSGALAILFAPFLVPIIGGLGLVAFIIGLAIFEFVPAWILVTQFSGMVLFAIVMLALHRHSKVAARKAVRF